MAAIGVPVGEDGVPMRACEGCGAWGGDAKAARLCLGPGEQHVELRQPEYDFCDDLIPIGARIFDRITRDLLG